MRRAGPGPRWRPSPRAPHLPVTGRSPEFPRGCARPVAAQRTERATHLDAVVLREARIVGDALEEQARAPSAPRDERLDRASTDIGLVGGQRARQLGRDGVIAPPGCVPRGVRVVRRASRDLRVLHRAVPAVDATGASTARPGEQAGEGLPGRAAAGLGAAHAGPPPGSARIGQRPRNAIPWPGR